MRQGERTIKLCLAPLQLHKRHKSLLPNPRVSAQKKKQVKRVSSIHHIQHSRKPELNRNKTYIDQSSTKKKEFSYCQSYRKHLSTVENYVFHDESRENIKVKATTERQSTNKENDEPITFRNNKPEIKKAMPPQQLRKLVKCLRQGEKPKLVLRLR